MISRLSSLAVVIAFTVLSPGQSPLAQRQYSEASGAQVVRVVAHDFAFDMPDVLPAGVTAFGLENEGKEPHHLMLYRLDTGHGLHDVFRTLSAGGAHPAWMHAVGGPNAIPLDGVATGTVLLAPGVYVAFCHVKSPDQRIHFSKGMLKSLTVTPSRSLV